MRKKRFMRLLLEIAIGGSVSAIAACTYGRGSCDDFEPGLVEYPRMTDAAPEAEPFGTELSIDRCTAVCGSAFGQNVLSCRIGRRPDTGVQYFDGSNTSLEVICVYNSVCEGRRPAGLLPAAGSGTALARFLHEVAYLEAASVIAFRSLARELRAHRAPRPLIAAARRAARDEIRHARSMSTIARARGIRVRAPDVVMQAPRTLLALALENAIEGCARETWGALFVAHQARHARDRELRGQLARIARDEARHAALAWSIHTWAKTRLPRDERTRLERAVDNELEAIAKSVARTPDDASLLRTAGVPSRSTSLAMLEALRAELLA